ncbi:MAG: hypothetical protein AAF547_13535 [Actinomycetota bacterium]
MDRGRLAGAAAVVLALLAAACANVDPIDGDAADPAPRPANGEFADEATILAIVDDLNRFWSVADEELGFDYTPVSPTRVTTGADGITCDRQPIEPDEVEGNAFVDSGCAEGLLVAYDPDYVGVSLARAEAVMAHEWGHVIQAQAEQLDLSLDPDGLPIDAELQADCLAGAWAAERADADIARLRQDTGGAGDSDDVPFDDPHAHGTPEERMAAFDVGVDGGPSACVDQLLDALPG